MNKQVIWILACFSGALALMALGALCILITIGWCLKRGMKLDTIVLVAKAICYMDVGFFTPLTAGLAQWANSGEIPGPIVWLIMFASCMVGTGSQLLSFLSGSYSDYMASRKPGGNGFDTSRFTQQPPPPIIAAAQQPKV